MFHPSTTNQDSRSLPSTEYSSVPRIQDNHAGRTYEFHFVAKEWPSEFSPWCQPWSLPWPEHILASQTEQLYPVETSDWDLELYEDETFSSEDAPSAQDGLVADQSEKPIAAIRCYYPECNKTFKREWNLKAHKRTHDSETLREHKCKECGRAFARGHDLVRHGITVRPTDKAETASDAD